MCLHTVGIRCTQSRSTYPIARTTLTTRVVSVTPNTAFELTPLGDVAAETEDNAKAFPQPRGNAHR